MIPTTIQLANLVGGLSLAVDLSIDLLGFHSGSLFNRAV